MKLINLFLSFFIVLGSFTLSASANEHVNNRYNEPQYFAWGETLLNLKEVSFVKCGDREVNLFTSGEFVNTDIKRAECPKFHSQFIDCVKAYRSRDESEIEYSCFSHLKIKIKEDD